MLPCLAFKMNLYSSMYSSFFVSSSTVLAYAVDLLYCISPIFLFLKFFHKFFLKLNPMCFMFVFGHFKLFEKSINLMEFLLRRMPFFNRVMYDFWCVSFTTTDFNKYFFYFFQIKIYFCLFCFNYLFEEMQRFWLNSLKCVKFPRYTINAGGCIRYASSFDSPNTNRTFESDNSSRFGGARPLGDQRTHFIQHQRMQRNVRGDTQLYVSFYMLQVTS